MKTACCHQERILYSKVYLKPLWPTSSNWPRTPRTRSQACTPGNELPVCEKLFPADPRSSSRSDARGSWSERRSSCHLAKLRPELPLHAYEHTHRNWITDRYLGSVKHKHVQRPVNYYRMFSCRPPVQTLAFQRLVLVIWIHDNFFASEVDDLVKVQSRHVHLPREEDGAVACEGQSEQRCIT